MPAAPLPRRAAKTAALLLALSHAVALPHVAALAGGAAALGAQDPAATSPAVAPRPLLEATLGGPAVWRTRLLPTNLGSLLASREGKQLWEPLVQPIEQLAGQLVGGSDAYAAARARFLDYGGTLVVRMWYDAATERPGFDCRLTADGRTDLAALGRDLAGAAARACRATWTADAALQVQTLHLGAGSRLTEPELRDGDLVFAIGDDATLPGALARARAAPARPAGARPTRDLPQPLHLEFDTAQAVQALDDDDMVAPLGLGALERFVLELGAAGPHVRLDMDQRFSSDERGLFAALFPATQGISGMARLLPEDAAAWKCGRFDWKALYRTMAAVVAGSSNEDDLDEWFGGDDETGIFAFVDDEYMMLATAPATDDEDRGGSYAIAFRVNDAEKFATAWDASRRHLGMTRLEGTDHDGVTIERLGGFFTIHSAVGRGMVVYGFGDEAPQLIADLLDAAKAHPDWQQGGEPPAASGAVRRHAPAGLNGVAQGHVALLLLQAATGLSALAELADDLPFPDWQAQPEDRDQALRLLEEHRLLKAWSMTGYHDRTWHFRILW